MAREDFLGESSGFSDFELEITEAWFGTVPEYNQGQTLLFHVIGKTNLTEQPMFTRDSFHPSYACGPDWTTLDGGKTATHPEGKKKFNNSSQVMRFFNTPALELTADMAGGADDPFAGDASAMKADSLVGTKWRFKDKTYTYKIGDGEEKQGRKITPVEYLGKGGSPAPAVSATAESAPAANGGSKVARAKLVALAKKSSTHDEFQAAALEMPEVLDDDALLAEVVDAETGIWSAR